MKEAYYFSHDSNAMTDPKILALRCDYGMEGYGTYWAIVEMFRNQDDYKLALGKTTYKSLKMLCSTSFDIEKFILDCIEYGLFVCDKTHFWSESLIKRMAKKDEAKEKKIKAIKSRWDKNKTQLQDDVDIEVPNDNSDELQNEYINDSDELQNEYVNDSDELQNEYINDTDELQMYYTNDSSVIQNDTNKKKGKEKKRKEKKVKENELKEKNEHTPTEKDTSPKNSGKEKNKYAEFVTMTNVEHERLVSTYGVEDAAKMIEILDNWKGVNPKKRTYESDYRAILNWVVDRLNEQKEKQNRYLSSSGCNKQENAASVGFLENKLGGENNRTNIENHGENTNRNKTKTRADEYREQGMLKLPDPSDPNFNDLPF